MEIINEIPTQDNDISVVILRIVFNSPIVGISKRDMVQKRIIFKHNKSIYCFQSSVEEKLGIEIYDPEKEIVRAISYINLTRIWEDETHYYMISFNQTDLRVFLYFIL